MLLSTSVRSTAQVSGDGEHASLLPFHWRSWCQVSYLDQNWCRYRPSHATVERKSELQATIFDNNVILRKMDIAMSSFKIKLWKALATTNTAPFPLKQCWSLAGSFLTSTGQHWPGWCQGRGHSVSNNQDEYHTFRPRYCRFRMTQCNTKITQKNKWVIVASSPFSPPPLLLRPRLCASHASTFCNIPQWRACLQANLTNIEAATGGKSSCEWFWKNSSQCQEIWLPV